MHTCEVEEEALVHTLNAEGMTEVHTCEVVLMAEVHMRNRRDGVVVNAQSRSNRHEPTRGSKAAGAQGVF